MSNKKSLRSSPQLVFEQQHGVVVAPKQLIGLYKKSLQTDIPFSTLIEVYQRGIFNHAIVANEVRDTPEQFAFNRVNSFIAGGKAAELDSDLTEQDGLWANIHAKRERIKNGSGERMRKPGSIGAPTPAALKRSQTKEETIDEISDQLVGRVNTLRSLGPNIMKDTPPTPHKTAKGAETLAKAVDKVRYRSKVGSVPTKEEYTGAEKTSKNMADPAGRFDGTTQGTNTYKNMTPGQSKTLSTIKKVVQEKTENWQKAKYKNPKGGMTKAGVNSYRRDHPGSKLQTAVTTPPSELKAGSKAANRRKSFCARMGGTEGPMKKPNGEPTRKALALRKWNC